MSNEDIHAKLAKHGKEHKDHKDHKDKHPDHDAKAEPEHTAGHEALTAKLAEAEEKAAQHWDRILRMQAEMENVQRRAERDLVNAHKFALDKFVDQLLPVIDNLERAVAHAEESKADAQAILEGVKLTLQMLHGVLEKSGVKQVDPLNQAFNPNFHEAVSMQPDENAKPGTVIAVLQKGYLLNERLVRPALVVVSK